MEKGKTMEARTRRSQKILDFNRVPKQFEKIQISTKDIIIDPFLNCLLKPINCFYSCMGWNITSSYKR